MFDTEILLRQSDPEIKGSFMLLKAVFVYEEDEETGRCDNLSYNGVVLTKDTPYEEQSITLYKKPDNSKVDFSVPNIVKFEQVFSFLPHFYINYLELNHYVDIQKDPTPSTMWMAKSIFQLFKNIREWSFMVEEPFNSDHPMATYSKLVMDSFNPPQTIIDEIDAMPDMHLAKFLKGQEDYMTIPHPCPVPSESFKNWIIELRELYSPKSFKDLLNEI